MTASFLVIVQIVLVIILVIAVLLQKSSSIGLGAYSGSNESVFGAKGPSGFLAKATFTIGFLFVANTITLGYMYSTANQASVVDDLVESTNIVAPSASVETVPSIEAATSPALETETLPETTPTAETTPPPSEETTK